MTKWKTDLQILSTLFFGLIMNHPFHDGNKRTAFLIMLYHLNLIGRTPIEREELYEELTVNIAANNLSVYHLTQRLHQSTARQIRMYILSQNILEGGRGR